MVTLWEDHAPSSWWRQLTAKSVLSGLKGLALPLGMGSANKVFPQLHFSYGII